MFSSDYGIGKEWVIGGLDVQKKDLRGLCASCLVRASMVCFLKTSAFGHALGFYINFLYISSFEFSLLLLCAFFFFLLLLYFWENKIIFHFFYFLRAVFLVSRTT